MNDRKYMEKEFYDSTEYFENLKNVFLNLNSRFQKYRIKNVLAIYNPGVDEIVMDIGCGWGTFVFILAGKVKKMIGLDISEKSIELCRNIAEEKGIEGIELICADAAQTGFPDNSIDVIICADLVEHLYPDIYLGIVKEVYRILRPGGKFIIWTPHRGHFIEILRNNNIILKKHLPHVDYKSMKTIEDSLTEKGFKIIKTEYRCSHLPVLNILERIFQSFIPIMRRRIAVLAEKEK